jgi:TNF receptor-associated protein 1
MLSRPVAFPRATVKNTSIGVSKLSLVSHSWGKVSFHSNARPKSFVLRPQRQFFPAFKRNFSNEQVPPPVAEAEVVGETAKVEETPIPPEPEVVVSEKVVGQQEKHEFQAETRKILDIVARSLYTDREVFVRELVSNASDALEKLRHAQLVGTQVEAPSALEINITTDSKTSKLIIQDSGIGMNKEEMIKNLGSIGHSGSLEFINQLKDQKSSNKDIIGQFGVGFYSVFMVSSKVTVFSRSALPGSKGYAWTSDGSGSYQISEAEGVNVGTKIVIELNKGAEEFAHKEGVEKIIKKYSNFVGFPIKLNGTMINTIKPLWTFSKKDISEQDHKEFYQFVAHAYDEPMLHLHYHTDSPLNIRALFYVGQTHNEKFGMGRMEPGVNLFCKKVLIQSRAKGLLPDWLRFIKGVVDSEDIPLNLSREHLQDSALIRRISNVLTKRILKWFGDEATKNPQKYKEFWDEYGNFLREGICTEFAFKEDIAKLLRAESSAMEADKLVSLDEYVDRADPKQEEIFYLCAPNRKVAEASPYYEAFKAKKKEVLFLYTQLDDFVMTNLQEYKKKKLISVESNAAKTALKKYDIETEEKDTGEAKLNKDELKELAQWMKEVLTGRVSSITESDRLVGSPAIIVDHESASMRRMMKYVDPTRAPELPKQQLEINGKHPIIKGLASLRKNNPDLATLITEQVFDNALIAAGLLDDARSLLPRINNLLSTTIKDHIDAAPVKTETAQPESTTKTEEAKA